MASSDDNSSRKHVVLKYDGTGVKEFLERDNNPAILRGIEVDCNCSISVDTDADQSPATLNIIKGDVTQADASVLVNTVTGSRRQLSSKSGTVAKVFAKQGGNALEEEYVSKGRVKKNEVLVTGSHGNLNCGWVLHLGIGNWKEEEENDPEQTLRQNIIKCLEAVDDLKVDSVAFPTIGCGALNYPPDTVATSMVEEVQNYGKSATSVKNVEIVAFTQELFTTFSKVYQQYTTTSKSTSSSTSISETEGGTLTLVHVNGQSADDAEKGAGKVEDIIEKGYTKERIKDPGIRRLADLDKVFTGIDGIHVKKGRMSLYLSGDKASVHEALGRVHKAMRDTDKRGHGHHGRRNRHYEHPDTIRDNKGYEAYLRAVAYGSVHLPSYWKNKRFNIDQVQFEQVDTTTHQTIMNTINYSMQQGGGHVSNVEMIDIFRLENCQMFSSYAYKRKLFCSKHIKGEQYPTMAGFGGEHDVLTRLANEDVLNKRLIPGINEYYMFHGTHEASVQAIREQGFDPRIAANGNFGSGIYFAENFVKADAFAGSKNNRKHMFLARVILGSPFPAQRTGINLRRPPCKDSACTNIQCRVHLQLHDSVVGLKKVCGAYREFIVYDGSMCYPEYVLVYKG